MATVTIPEQQIAGETVIDLGTSQLVKARSEPGGWYVVEAGRCSCPGFTYRGKCRHLAAVTPAPTAARPPIDLTDPKFWGE